MLVGHPFSPPWHLNTPGPRAATAGFFLSHHWEFPPFLLWMQPRFPTALSFSFLPLYARTRPPAPSHGPNPGSRVDQRKHPPLSMGTAQRRRCHPGFGGVCATLYYKGQPRSVPTDAATCMDRHIAIH